MKLKRLVLAGFSLLSTASFAQDFNYGEALQKSILFYEAQQSGVLPEWNRISWRSDSGVNDGKDVGLDLSGGWNDAGDHIKFGFPMAFSVSALNWGFLEYKEGYDTANQTEHFKRNIKWVTDYFIKCHPTPNEFYAQVSFKGQDHSYWMPAEMVDVHPMYGQRESFKVDTANPGTDIACETAAALASASIIFKDSDPDYSETLLDHAKELYTFGDNYRGTYTGEGNIPAVGTYTSNGFEDELVWGALWLYKATGDEAYLTKAEEEYTEPDYLWSLAWDDKRYANMVILAQITDKQKYKDNCERHLQFWIDNGEGVAYSPGGQAHLTQWGSLRHSMNAALVALIYSDSVDTPNKQTYYDFAVSQMNYILGDNPIGRSFLMGFGVNPPTKPHHRGQHSSWIRSESIPAESRHELYGALIGGPGAADDGFEEDRSDFQENEVACDYNACFQGVLARMVMDFGGDPLPNFPQPETPGQEYLNEVKIGQSGTNNILVNIYLNNRTGWPARVPETLSARYFIDITEALDAGLTVDDYELRVNGVNGSLNGGLQVWDRENNIYFAEVQVNEGYMPFPGGQGEYRTEIQLNISLSPTTDPIAWDLTNDFSYQGLTEELVEFDNVPIYANGILVGGNEPAGGDTPKALFAATPEIGFAPLVVEFDASESSDPNGDTITYTWIFGNGETSTSKTPTITFDEIGSYEVSLTVSDGTNTSTAYTKTITVEDPNIAPVAVIETSETAGIAPFTIDFDASNSTDENGDTLTYSWDFGDGNTSSTESTSHTYNTTGEFEVVLTVSDGAKSDTEKVTITINDGSPVIGYSFSINSLEAPFEVSFDASASVDPEGGNLTYSWDFGNGTTASTVVATATYAEDGDYTVSLTVLNESGKQDSEEFVVSVGNSNCVFDTPRATPLPSVDNESFENIFVLGEDGPSVDSIERFVINWNLANNGLYQFAFQYNQQAGGAYIGLTNENLTQNFNSSQPEITISNSGIAGLDGSYYVTVEEENFVMVSKTEGFTLYFSKTATEPECSNNTNIDLSNPVLDLANYEISLRPNPATEFVNIVVKTTEDFKDVVKEVTIVNLLGQVIVTKPIVQGETLVNFDVNSLPVGVYLVQINVDGQQLNVEKLVVE